MVLALTLAASLAASSPEASRPSLLRELTIDLEGGPAYVVQNDNRYGPSGTDYTAADVGQQRNLFIGKRLSAEARFHRRHRVILLYAPLDLTMRVTLGRAIDFNGIQFATGEVVDHRYLFDGYRASYLFALLAGERLRWELGGSLQIRNASVELRTVDEAAARFAVERDIGLVFALKSRLSSAPSDRWWTALEADGISTLGLGDVSGALYDLSLSVGAPVREGADLFLRLRWLGGGAGVPAQDIDNWANFLFVTVGMRMELTRL